MKKRANTTTKDIIYLVAETEAEDEIFKWIWENKGVIFGRGPRELSVSTEKHWRSYQKEKAEAK